MSHYGHEELNLRKSMEVIMNNSMNKHFLHFFLALYYNAILVDPKLLCLLYLFEVLFPEGLQDCSNAIIETEN